MTVYPFSSDREIGTVSLVEGTIIEVRLRHPSALPRSHFGEHLGQGEMGQFIITDVGGVAIFGRITKIASDMRGVSKRTAIDEDAPATARVQLLSTLYLDGKSDRGVLRYPNIGDRVYAASAHSIVSVLSGTEDPSSQVLHFGSMSIDDGIPVRIPLGRVFGRHLAVVGAAGSGKSWTLAHLAEQVMKAHGKMILLDATGEFHTLEASSRHLAFSDTTGEPLGTTLVGIPHEMMRASDRNAFLNPSSGAQLPRLREAIKTLRLVQAIQNDPNALPEHSALIEANGTIKKANRPMREMGEPLKKYVTQVENPSAPFNLKGLAVQVQNECVWPSARNNSENYGDLDYSQIGYVSTLISRINDLLQTREIMDVIVPPKGTANIFDEIEKWLRDKDSHVLRVSLRSLTFANNLREILVNILGQWLIGMARHNAFKETPMIVAIDEAHQFFDVTVGNELSSTRLNAFDLIAKEGRKYGLTVCLATQRPGDLPGAVLSQVGMTIAHRLVDGNDRQRVENAAAEIDGSAARLLPGLTPGEAVLMGVDFPVPISVRISPPVHRPESEGPRYVNWRVEGPGPESTMKEVADAY